ncbi:hypothetical protein [Adhaeribacter soli]
MLSSAKSNKSSEAKAPLLFSRRGWGWLNSRIPKRQPDLLQNPIQLLKNLLILKPQNLNSMALQKRRPFRIRFKTRIRKMVPPIQFNRQPFRRTIKIQNILPKTMLPPELPSLQLTSLQSFPKHRFRRGQVTAELFSKNFQVRLVMQRFFLLRLHGFRVWKAKARKDGLVHFRLQCPGSTTTPNPSFFKAGSYFLPNLSSSVL